MIISTKKYKEMVEREIAKERNRMYTEQQLERLGRELYSEVGRLETMIRDVERRVMGQPKGDMNAKTNKF